MKHIKIITLAIGILFLSTLIFVGVANAQSFKSGDKITVAANETIDSMFFAGGNNVDIAGTINGDVFCAGQTVNISGVVNGDVFCAGETINISGKIDGNVRLAGQSVTLSGQITRSATVGAETLFIEKGSVISQDLMGGNKNITVNGNVKRDFLSGSEVLTINGKIGRNITGDINVLSVGSNGLIGGNIDYTGLNDPNVNSGGQIIGQVTGTEPKTGSEQENSTPFVFSFIWFIGFLITMITLSLCLVGLFPGIFKNAASKAIKSPGKVALAGAIATFAIPTLIIILLITIIGIPLAILCLLIWFTFMILTGPFVSYLLGSLILKKSKSPILIMLLGTVILTTCSFIPLIGFITAIFSYVVGMGMIMVESGKHFARTSK